jgi:hypothetical protein
MTVKKKYNVGDTVWIYGIQRDNVKSTQGTVVKAFTIEGYNEVHYVVEIPTEIEPLLEIRTWQTISQTADGHVGSLREAFSDPDAAHKMLSRTGMAVISLEDEENDDTVSFAEDDISPDAIHAALEKSRQDVSHGPLNLKSEKPKRRNFARKKKA